MLEKVADRDPVDCRQIASRLLVEEVGDPIVEIKLSAVDQAESRDGGDRLRDAGKVKRIVGGQRLPGEQVGMSRGADPGRAVGPIDGQREAGKTVVDRALDERRVRLVEALRDRLVLGARPSAGGETEGERDRSGREGESIGHSRGGARI